MGIKPKQYSIFTMLRKRVLDAAVEEINEKTDISLDYDLEKEGRKIAAVTLFVHAKKDKSTPVNTPNAIREKLKEFGIKERKIEELISKHDEQYLWANIAIVEEELKKGNITNVTGYLLKAFQDDYRPQLTPNEKKLQKKQEHKAKEEQLQAEQQTLLKAQKTAFENWKNSLLEEKLNAMGAEEYEQLKTAFTEEIQANNLFTKFYRSKGFDHPVIQIQWHKYLTPSLLSAEESSFEAFQSLQNPIKKDAFHIDDEKSGISSETNS